MIERSQDLAPVGPELAAEPGPDTRVDSAGARPWRARLGIALAVGALLAVYATLTIMASRTKGLSFDEGLQLAVGYNLWHNGDYRIEGANGDLIKRWATLPYLFSRPKFVSREEPNWLKGDAYELGRQFLFELGNSPKALLQQSRAMITLLGVATGLLVFFCSRHVFGPVGGLVSLALFAFSPHMLAFGGIVSTDLSITLTLFAATWWGWRLLHEISWGRLLGSLGWAGLLVLAKPTCLVIFPIMACLIAVKLIRGRTLIVHLGSSPRSFPGRRAQAAVFAALIALHMVAGWGALWAHYGFRYTASPEPANPRIVFYQAPGRDAVPPPLASTLKFLERTHALPEGFIRGIDALLGCDDGLAAFVRGHWRLGGWFWFFPYAIWVKTHPVTFALVALALGTWWYSRRRSPAAGRGPSWYESTPWLALIGCYLAVAMTEDVNIGHRHVLPIYPALYVLAGAVVLVRGQRAIWQGGIVGALIAWLATDVVAKRPDYLAYFGPQAGGSAQGYKHLVDSSLDWGMSLPALKQWLDRNNPQDREPVFLAYFGADDPDYYGIKARRLPGFFERRRFEPYPLTPGLYAISASLLQGVYTTAFGPWSKAYEKLYREKLQTIAALQAAVPDLKKQLALFRVPKYAPLADDFELFDNLRFARLCAWLRQHREPNYQVEHAILIFRLDYRDLQAAMYGPAAELVDRPAKIRRYRHIVAPGQ